MCWCNSSSSLKKRQKDSYPTMRCRHFQRAEAEQQFADAEKRQAVWRPHEPLLHSMRGYQYCDLLISEGNYAAARDYAAETIAIARQAKHLLSIGLDTLTIGRAHLGLALGMVADAASTDDWPDDARTVRARLDEAVESLRASGDLPYIARGLLTRAAFCRSLGDRSGTARDLNEIEEIGELGPMKLHLCDVAIERARLALARVEAFAPLNGLLDDATQKPKKPSRAERNSLLDEAAKHLAVAADYIEKCGYHRRVEELAELQAVSKGGRAYADLPPRVQCVVHERSASA
jgi:hypothetical protein